MCQLLHVSRRHVEIIEHMLQSLCLPVGNKGTHLPRLAVPRGDRRALAAPASLLERHQTVARGNHCLQLRTQVLRREYLGEHLVVAQDESLPEALVPYQRPHHGTADRV